MPRAAACAAARAQRCFTAATMAGMAGTVAFDYFITDDRFYFDLISSISLSFPSLPIFHYLMIHFFFAFAGFDATPTFHASMFIDHLFSSFSSSSSMVIFTLRLALIASLS